MTSFHPAGWLGRPAVRVPAPLLREIARAVAQLALRRRYGIGRGRDCARRRARFGPQLFHAGQSQSDLGAAPGVWRWRIVERFDVEPQRVAGQETAVLGIDPPLHDRPIADAADVERFPHRLADAAGAAHPPAHDRQSRDAVIVSHIGDELLTQRNRQGRITAGDRQCDERGRIGKDQEMQLGRGSLQRGTVGAQRPQPPRAARRGRKAAVYPRPGNAQPLDARFERPPGARERHARRPTRDDGRTGGQRDHLRAHEQRLVGATEI